MIKKFFTLISLFFLFGAGKVPKFTELEIKKIEDIRFIKSIGGQGSIPGKFLFPSDVLILEGKTDYLQRGFDEILVVDKNNHRIQKFDLILDYEYSFGNFNQFNSPFSIAGWTKSYIYISDSLNHRIVNYDIKGNFKGILSFLPAKESTLDTYKLKLNEPKGIDVGKDGNIYIADSGQDRIIVVSPTGYFLYEIKGEEWIAEYFSNPSDVKIDDSGNIYIADTGNDRILVFDSLFRRLLLKIEKLNKPEGLTIDNAGNIFISDTGNNKVLIYNIKGEFIDRIDYKFNRPLGLAISQEKKTEKGEIYRNLYVADSGNHQVLLFRIIYRK